MSMDGMCGKEKRLSGGMRGGALFAIELCCWIDFCKLSRCDICLLMSAILDDGAELGLKGARAGGNAWLLTTGGRRWGGGGGYVFGRLLFSTDVGGGANRLLMKCGAASGGGACAIDRLALIAAAAAADTIAGALTRDAIESETFGKEANGLLATLDITGDGKLLRGALRLGDVRRGDIAGTTFDADCVGSGGICMCMALGEPSGCGALVICGGLMSLLGVCANGGINFWSKGRIPARKPFCSKKLRGSNGGRVCAGAGIAAEVGTVVGANARGFVSIGIIGFTTIGCAAGATSGAEVTGGRDAKAGSLGSK